ncbi:hypothetical protein RFI_32029, partial [Reticulomyxa filosa]
MILAQQYQQQRLAVEKILLFQQSQAHNRVIHRQGAQPMSAIHLRQPFAHSQIDQNNNTTQSIDSNNNNNNNSINPNNSIDNNNIPLQNAVLTFPSVLEELLPLQFYDNPILAHQ